MFITHQHNIANGRIRLVQLPFSSTQHLCEAFLLPLQRLISGDTLHRRLPEAAVVWRDWWNEIPFNHSGLEGVVLLRRLPRLYSVNKLPVSKVESRMVIAIIFVDPATAGLKTLESSHERVGGQVVHHFQMDCLSFHTYEDSDPALDQCFSTARSGL